MASSRFTVIYMDINLIADTIYELEDSDTTFSNVQELAALYIVKDYMCRLSNEVETKEYRDILPRYTDYIKIKRRYQLQEAPKDAIVQSIRYVCKELQEFICTMYACTDTIEERQQIEEMISAVYDNYNKTA